MRAVGSPGGEPRPSGGERSGTPRQGAARGSPEVARDGGRWHLYVSYACPWAHRTLIARTLLDLEEVLPATNMHPVMGEAGWRLSGGTPLRDLYRRWFGTFEGRATVPVLVDERLDTVVSNESAEIMRLLGRQAGEPYLENPLIPSRWADEVERLNGFVQVEVNEAVYRAAFAPDDAVRDRSTARLLDALRALDTLFAERRYLVEGAPALECDWRLWTTLVRYDPAYRPLFLSRQAPSLTAFPNLARFADRLMHVPGIAATFRLDEVVAHFDARASGLGRVRT